MGRIMPKILRRKNANVECVIQSMRYVFVHKFVYFYKPIQQRLNLKINERNDKYDRKVTTS